MIKYISSSSYRKHYDFLESYKMFSSKFYNVSMTMMREELFQEFFQGSKISKNVSSLLEIQVKKAATPQIKIKTLWLIHLLIQLIPTQILQAM